MNHNMILNPQWIAKQEILKRHTDPHSIYRMMSIWTRFYPNGMLKFVSPMFVSVTPAQCSLLSVSFSFCIHWQFFLWNRNQFWVRAEKNSLHTGVISKEDFCKTRRNVIIIDQNIFSCSIVRSVFPTLPAFLGRTIYLFWFGNRNNIYCCLNFLK